MSTIYLYICIDIRPCIRVSMCVIGRDLRCKNEGRVLGRGWVLFRYICKLIGCHFHCKIESSLLLLLVILLVFIMNFLVPLLRPF